MTPSSPTRDQADALGAPPGLLHLARALVHDRHAAEDIVQEALLVGWRQAPTDTARYLRGVVRNLSRRHHRTLRRRGALERSAARPETCPDAGAALERLALQRRIADAVLGLAEPYRATVVLRYWEGLPPRTIARRHGVPVATVRSRLQRARQQLRARLDRGPDGRAGWFGVALSYPHRPPPARAPFWSTPLDPFPRPLMITLSTAAVALATASLLFSPHAAPTPIPPRAAATPGAVAAAAAAGFRFDAGAASRRSPLAATALQQPAATELPIRLVTAEGTPAAGAVVVAWLLPAIPADLQGAGPAAWIDAARAGRITSGAEQGEAVARAVADAAGRCTLALPEGRVRLHARGTDGASSGWVHVPDRTGEVTLRLVPVCRVQGQVVAPDGAGLAGARVGFAPVGGRAGFRPRLPRPVITGNDGRFAVELDPHVQLILCVEDEPRTEQVRLWTEPGADVRVILRALGAAHLAVALTGVDDAAAGFAWARFAEPEPGTTPDTQQAFHGTYDPLTERFRIPLPVAGTFDVYVHSDGCTAAPRRASVAAGEVLELTLAAAQRVALHGVVLDVAGRPQPGVQVTRCELLDDGTPTRCTRARTDAAGRFVFEDTRAGQRYELSWPADASGDSRGVRQVVATEAATPLELRAEPATPVEVEVVDATNGRPVRAFTLAVAHERNGGWRTGPEVAVGDDHGRAQVPGVAVRQRYGVRVAADGFAAAVVLGVHDGSTAKVALQRPGSLTVRVVEATGRPADAVEVRLGPADAQPEPWPLDRVRHLPLTDATGLCAAAGLIPGRYQLWAAGGARGGDQRDVEIVGGEAATVTLRLPR